MQAAQHGRRPTGRFQLSTITGAGADLALPLPGKDKACYQRRWPHVDACAAAGIEHLALHRPRRSLGTLSDGWNCLPAWWHRFKTASPALTAEEHYRVRRLDLLRVHHERFEA